jgi:hypothetical protein
MFRKYNKPAFLIIGAQKAGTSSLFRYLSQHPDIRLPKRKELHFFDVKYENGTDWYEEQFPASSLLSGQITGEASPFYLFHPLVPERVHDFLHIPHIPPTDISPVNTNQYPDLLSSDRKKLEEHFREDGQLLRKLIGNHFSWF